MLVHRPGTPAEVLISGAHVLSPRDGIDATLDVVIRDGTIAELGAHDPARAAAHDNIETVAGNGKHLLCGFVDPHVHLRVPGQEYKEDLDSGTRAAAAGGYVAIVAQPNTEPTVDSASVLRSLTERARREAHIPVGFMGSITRGLAGDALTEMADMRDAGAVGFTDDGRPVRRANIMRQALRYQKLVGLPLALHEEDPALTAGGVMHEGELSARLGLAGVPSISEASAIARDAAIAAYEDGRIHIQHLSTEESVQAVADAKTRGIAISAEVSPHHLTLTCDILAERLDARAKMFPPLTEESDRLALIEGLRSGVIDCIATDHAPHARHEKEVPFELAPMGTTGLETAFAALYTYLVGPGVLPLQLIVDRLSAGAALLDLPLPRIAVGEPANLCLVDLEHEWEVGADGYESKSENCCFAGRRLRGKVLLTIAAGTIRGGGMRIRLVSASGPRKREPADDVSAGRRPRRPAEGAP